MRSSAPRYGDAWRKAALVIAGVAICLAVLALGLAHRRPLSWLGTAELASSVDSIAAAVREAGMWGPAASVALMVLHSFAPFPAELLAVANGRIFGLPLGILVTWAGAMLGALAAYGLARWLGRPFVRRVVAERHWRRIEEWTEWGGSGGLLLARLIPVISFNLVNYAAGLAGIGWWRFIWTTALGILPAITASVLVGSHMLRAPWWVWGCSALAVLAAVILYRQPWRRHGPSAPDV